MAKIAIKAFEARGSGGSGVSLGLLARKDGAQIVRLGLTASAQDRYVFGALTDDDAIALDLDDSPGKTHLMRLRLVEADAPDALPFSGGIRGSISLKLTQWLQLASGKRPARAMDVVAQEGTTSILCKLPEWARPPARKIGQGKGIMDD